MVRNSYLIFLPLMLSVSIVGGIDLGHRALKPADRMTRAAAHTISIRNLSRRLPVPQTGDEIERLAETWNQVLALESATGANGLPEEGFSLRAV
jgi:nitrogen fixation/metabolism regulation signal transduction histidine kinase